VLAAVLAAVLAYALLAVLAPTDTPSSRRPVS
jgi:hypothetical protein